MYFWNNHSIWDNGLNGFDVKVKKVNIMNVRGKDKRVGRYTGKTARRRKAIVTLTEDSNSIKIFNDNESKEK